MQLSVVPVDTDVFGNLDSNDVALIQFSFGSWSHTTYPIPLVRYGGAVPRRPQTRWGFEDVPPERRRTNPDPEIGVADSSGYRFVEMPVSFRFGVGTANDPEHDQDVVNRYSLTEDTGTRLRPPINLRFFVARTVSGDPDAREYVVTERISSVRQNKSARSTVDPALSRPLGSDRF